MFCEKCGKENKDGVKFCAYCGEEMELQDGINSEIGRRPGIKATDILLIAVYIILAIPWTDVFISNREVTEAAFEWLGSDGAIGAMVYTLLYMIILAIVVIGILSVVRQKYYVWLGGGTMLMAVVAMMGRKIYNEVSFETWELIGYRVFLVYGHIWIPTLIIGAILTVLLYIKKAEKNKTLNI